MIIEQAFREWHVWLDLIDAVIGLNKPNSKLNSLCKTLTIYDRDVLMRYKALKSIYRDLISPASPMFHASQSNRNLILISRKKATVQCKVFDPVCANSTLSALLVFYTS